jgi:arylsulfatase A-like enzyme
MRNLFFGILISLASCPTFGQQTHQQPNIVFILADDLGYGDLAPYGQKHIETPRIAQLAKSGLTLTNFYSGTTVCAPSRSAIMSGQHTGHTYIRGNKEIEPEGQEPLADSVQTIAMLLKDAGYTTGAFGKWGLGMVGTSGAPDVKGFDTFYGYNCQRQSHRYYPTHLWHNNERIVLEGNDLTTKRVYAADLIQEQTLNFIENNKDNPFFLFVPTILPHAELAGPLDSLYQKYENKFEETPHKGQDYGPEATVSGYASVEKPRAMFASMVNRFDTYVGQIVDRLRDLNLLDNTIIIISSDNGPHLEGGADPDFFDSSAGVRGRKRDLYEGGIRVPLIISWPAVIPQARTSEHIAAAWDLMPTFVELANAQRPHHTDGISLLPTILNSKKQPQHEHLYWEFMESGGRQAVREKDWKLVVLQAKDKENRKVELYNLKDDPYEQHDIAQKHPDQIKKMLKIVEEAHVESPIFNFYN